MRESYDKIEKTRFQKDVFVDFVTGVLIDFNKGYENAYKPKK